MANLLNKIEEILLMGPGPSCVHESVYEALGKKTIGHLDPIFITIMDEIKGQLEQSELIHSVSTASANKEKRGNRIQFKLKITLSEMTDS